MNDYSGILLMTDLDGTFMNRKGELVERNLRALDRFKAGGGLFTFATGRVHTTIERFLLPGWRELINCPAILCNGACVFDPTENRILHQVTMRGEDVRHAVGQLFHSGRYTVNLYAGGDYTCYQDVPPEKIESECWHKAVFVGEPKDVSEGWAWLAAQGESGYRFFRSAPHILEILPAQGGKGAMLAWLKRYYASLGRRVITVGAGDFENDLDLMEQADIGIAVANAIEPVKAAADRVLCTNDDGVIGDILDCIDRGELIGEEARFGG